MSGDLSERRVFSYDTTLRDGTQGEDVAFTPEDKVRIAHLMDDVGIDYIEGGYPGSNPRDRIFFEEMRRRPLKRARLVAFGMTMRSSSSSPAHDTMLRTLIEAQTPALCIVGKSWDLHVTDALRIGLDENLAAVEATVRYLKAEGREVFFDAEHFFDGWANNPEYALKVLEAAVAGGADWLVLCDTNGGALPDAVGSAVSAVRRRFPQSAVGIHTHNDADLAVANALEAVAAGARLVQGTVGGIGERCGNANLISMIANLDLKLGYSVIAPEGLRRLTELTDTVFELANLAHPRNLPYVGRSAFAHKGGMHVSGIRRNSLTYEHIDPALVGNERRILLSDLAGRATVVDKLQSFGLEVTDDDPRVGELLDELKTLESQGYQYEAAEASFELLARRKLTAMKPIYELVSYRCHDERAAGAPPRTEATIVVRVGQRTEHTVASGNGPVSALDQALRRALVKFYPELASVRLVDYKVRVLGSGAGTDAVVRVLIESADDHSQWGTVGVGTNIIDASYEALHDALEFKCLRAGCATGARAAGG